MRNLLSGCPRLAASATSGAFSARRFASETYPWLAPTVLAAILADSPFSLGAPNFGVALPTCSPGLAGLRPVASLPQQLRFVLCPVPRSRVVSRSCAGGADSRTAQSQADHCLYRPALRRLGWLQGQRECRLATRSDFRLSAYVFGVLLIDGATTLNLAGCWYLRTVRRYRFIAHVADERLTYRTLPGNFRIIPLLPLVVRQQDGHHAGVILLLRHTTRNFAGFSLRCCNDPRGCAESHASHCLVKAYSKSAKTAEPAL